MGEWLTSIGQMSGCVPCVPITVDDPDDPTFIPYGPAKEGPMAEGSASQVQPPDRRSFERQLSDINRALGERGKLLQETRAKLRELGEQRLQLREMTEDGRERSKELDAPIDAQNQLLDAKAKELSAMEGDLLYTNMDKLERRLGKVEGEYHRRTFRNAREEQDYVVEIDRLKRNHHRLGKFLLLQDEKKVLEQKCKELKEQQKAANRFAQHKQFQLRNVRKQRQKLLQRINGEPGQGQMTEGLGSEVRNLELSKRNLIERYNSEATDYRKSCPPGKRRHNNKPAKFAASYPRGNFPRKKEDEGSDSEDETLELFYEQKQLCRNLLAYLQPMLEQCEESVLAEAKAKSSDSQLTPTPSFAGSSTESGPPDADARRPSLKAPDELLEPPATNNKKRNSRKKRGNQSISIDGLMYNAFQRLGIQTIPGTYAEVPGVVAQVEELLGSFEGAAQIAPSYLNPNEWSLEDRPLFVDASSESSRTDSAWGSYSQSFSDAGSLSQVSFPDDASPSPAGALPSFPRNSAPSHSVPGTPAQGAAKPPIVHLPPDSSALRRALVASPGMKRSQSAEGPGLEREETVTVDEKIGNLRLDPTHPNPSDEGIAACSKDSSTSSASHAHDVQAIRNSLAQQAPTKDQEQTKF